MIKDKEAYKDYCKKEIESILESSFMNCNPFEMGDVDIIIDADVRSKEWTHTGNGFCSDVSRFCSLMVIDGTDTKYYGGIDTDRFVEVLKMHPLNYSGRDKLEVPINQFQYPMMLDKGLGIPFNPLEADIVCCLDDHHDRDSIMFNNNGIVLYSHYIGGITRFGQKRPAYRFCSFTRETLPDVLRREIVKSQFIVIDYLFQFPAYCAPSRNGYRVTSQEAAHIMVECADIDIYRNMICSKRDLIIQRNPI